MKMPRTFIAVLAGIFLFVISQLFADTRIWCKSGTDWIQIGSISNTGDGDTYFNDCNEAYNYLHHIPSTPKPSTPRPTSSTPTPYPLYQSGTYFNVPIFIPYPTK